MPWTSRDAYRHTKKANTPGVQAKWAKIANAALQEYGDEARAIRTANAAVAGTISHRRRRRAAA
jgi:hypothetical protein